MDVRLLTTTKKMAAGCWESPQYKADFWVYVHGVSAKSLDKISVTGSTNPTAKLLNIILRCPTYYTSARPASLFR